MTTVFTECQNYNYNGNDDVNVNVNINGDDLYEMWSIYKKFFSFSFTHTYSQQTSYYCRMHTYIHKHVLHICTSIRTNVSMYVSNKEKILKILFKKQTFEGTATWVVGQTARTDRMIAFIYFFFVLNSLWTPTDLWNEIEMEN